MGSVFLYAQPPKQNSFAHYMRTVCEEAGISLDLVCGPTRRQEVADLRHVLMCVGTREYGLPSECVAQMMGRDRTMCIHAVKRIRGICLDPFALNTYKHLQSCLHVADDVFFDEWGHHFKTISKWLIVKK